MTHPTPGVVLGRSARRIQRVTGLNQTSRAMGERHFFFYLAAAAVAAGAGTPQLLACLHPVFAYLRIARAYLRIRDVSSPERAPSAALNEISLRSQRVTREVGIPGSERLLLNPKI